VSFDAEEKSVQDARAIELYEFTVGFTVFRFTNSEREESFDGNTWTPTPIERDQIRVSSDEPGSSVQILMSVDHPSAINFTKAWVARAATTGDTRVRIYRHHQDDVAADFQLFWIGFLVSPAYEDDGAVLSISCKSLDNLFTLQGPRKNWGSLCNHQLYGTECALSESAFTHGPFTIGSVAADGVTYTVTGLDAATVTYIGGELRKAGTFAQGLIVAISGSDITVQYPIPDIVVGDIVQVVEGCDHTLTQCALFPNVAEASGTNVENFGASPFTPPVNLFTKGGDAL